MQDQGQTQPRRRAAFAGALRILAAAGLAAVLVLDGATMVSAARSGGGGMGGHGGGGYGPPSRGGYGPPSRGGGEGSWPGGRHPGGGGRWPGGRHPGHHGGGVYTGGGYSGGDDGGDGSPRHRRRTTRRSTHHEKTAAHPRPTRTKEARASYVLDEVLTRIKPGTSPRAVGALARRFRLVQLETQTLQLTGASLVRWRIPKGKSVPAVVRALGDADAVAAAQPNYIFTVQDEATAAPEGDPAQYALAKLNLPQAHRLAKGAGVLVAIVDSGIDQGNAELDGAVAEAFDAIGASAKSDPHGTEVAGIIAAHGKLMGAAPAARILAVRAFAAAGSGGAEGTTFGILKGIDWAAVHGARVVNLSFAGPADSELGSELKAARAKGVVLIAAAGNGGPQSPPLYPAADPNVVAVTATDAHDRLFGGANRGRYIALAAPGVDILVPAPDGAYQVASGTSFAAAYVSGIAALLLERQVKLSPEELRQLLVSTAKALGGKGHDGEFGAGLADAYRAVQAVQATASTAGGR